MRNHPVFVLPRLTGSRHKICCHGSNRTPEKGDPTFDVAQAIVVMLEKHGIAFDIFHGFSWDKWTTGKPAEHLALTPTSQRHILEQEGGKKRFAQMVAGWGSGQDQGDGETNLK